LGFVTCAPEALCDALERVARETCDALRLSQNEFASSSSSSSSSIDAIPKGKADPADAVRLAVLRGRDALLALDDAAENIDDDDDDDVDAPPPDDALAAKLRELNELFPEYGDGYLAAALDAFGGDVNETASRLFEGDLTPALAALDARTSWRARWAAQNPKLKNKNDTGRLSAKKRTESHTEPASSSVSSVWTKKPSSSFSRDESASPPGREYHKNGDVAYMTRRQKSAYGLESGYDASEAKKKILDLAYDDEYDDSFDELNELAGVANDAGETYEKEKKNEPSVCERCFRGGNIWRLHMELRRFRIAVRRSRKRKRKREGEENLLDRERARVPRAASRRDGGGGVERRGGVRARRGRGCGERGARARSRRGGKPSRVRGDGNGGDRRRGVRRQRRRPRRPRRARRARRAAAAAFGPDAA
jgi:activating signal cointegrator complex subunit 2